MNVRIAESSGRRSVSSLLGFMLLAASASAWDRPVRCAADLGSTSVDVSDYPPEHQRTYQEQFVTKCNICHSTARPLASPMLELSAAELAALPAAVRAVAADPEVLRIGLDVWKKYLHRMWKRPPCCDLCPVFTKAEITAIWKFLVYDSQRRKTGPALARWVGYRRGLIDEYHRRERKGELP